MGRARCHDSWAASRILSGKDAQERAQKEARVFSALSCLQGKGIPELLGAGPLPHVQATFYTATKFLQVLCCTICVLARSLAGSHKVLML